MNLKELRKRNGLTQKELATDCNISLKMISSIEQNVRRPSPELAKRFAEIFNLTINEIWEMFYE